METVAPRVEEDTQSIPQEVEDVDQRFFLEWTWIPLTAARSVSDLAPKTKETIRSIKEVADTDIG